MEVLDNVIYFDNDDEFYDYCVEPKLITIPFVDKNGDTRYYTDFNFTNAYNNDVKDGKIFIIKDENSQIYKHKAVSYRTITKEISNLEPWYKN